MNSISRPAAYCLVILVSAALSGCGDDVLDWRNAELSNGMVYAEGENEPFSGQVTNVPYATVLGQQKGYHQLMGQGASIVTMLYGSAMLCDVRVSDGVLDGDMACKAAQQREVLMEGSFEDGGLVGKFIMRDGDTNQVVTEAEFDGGQLDGTIRKYDPKTGQLVLEQGIDMGRADGAFKQWNASGELLVDASFSEGKLDGAYLQRDEFGQDTAKGRYDDGVYTGTRIDYRYAHYSKEPRLLIDKVIHEIEDDQVANQPEIDAQRAAIDQIDQCVSDMERMRGDEDGASMELTDRIATYLGQCKDKPEAADEESRAREAAREAQRQAEQQLHATAGQEGRMSFPEQSNECTTAWHDAFRREHGEEAIIRYDMAWEFVDNCRAGLRP